MKLLKIIPLYILASLLTLITTRCYAQSAQSSVVKYIVNGEERQAIVSKPNGLTNVATPLIFAFHGHGGNMKNIQKSRNFEQLWPEAIIVYPQGLKTPGMLTDPEGKKSGWVMQGKPEQNRDLLFFDELLKKLKAEYKIDEKRIYATGHSNGGGFVYLLWAERPQVFAAYAPTATVGGKNLFKLSPKPVFHLTGLSDQLVQANRQSITHKILLKLNECNMRSFTKIDSNITRYPGKNGNEIILYIHNGGHGYPPEANKAIVNFFKNHKNVKP